MSKDFRAGGGFGVPVESVPTPESAPESITVVTADVPPAIPPAEVDQGDCDACQKK